MPVRGLNSCAFIGNLGSDPELRDAGNAKVVNVSIAVNDVWGTGDDVQEKVEWVPLVFWNRLAEVLVDYCKKGAKLYIGGRLQTRSWEDGEGNKHYKTEITVRDMLMLDSTPSSGTLVRSAQTAPQVEPEFELQPPVKVEDDLPF